jgi:ABC-type phosphate/phosphonate transport system permease subunit
MVLLIVLLMGSVVPLWSENTPNPFDFEDTSEMFLAVWTIVICGTMVAGFISIPFQLVAAQQREEQAWRDRNSRRYSGEFSVSPGFIGVNLHLK